MLLRVDGVLVLGTWRRKLRDLTLRGRGVLAFWIEGSKNVQLGCQISASKGWIELLACLILGLLTP